MTFESEEDKQLTKKNCLVALASLAARPDTKDHKLLEKLNSFFKEQYYQMDTKQVLVNILSGAVEQNPSREFLSFFQMVESDSYNQYKEIAKQSRIKLEVLNSPDADKQLVNILYTNYDYDVPSQDLDTYKAIRTWAAREMANKDSVAATNIPVHMRILHLRNIVHTESNRPYNVDDQLIRWSISSIIDLGEELTPEEKEILRNLH
ncbi:hypothetical protein HY605_05485 [Candidatus Peregrinibacteria bacterium]|nr:hypothetical protein [Candidatus Peregrinibacteria bacterium]